MRNWDYQYSYKLNRENEMIVTAVPLMHTERQTMTWVVLWTRLHAGGSVSHKLTDSILCTQHVYKQATAHHCYRLAEHIYEQGLGYYWSRRHIKNPAAYLAAAVCSVGEQKQRHCWLPSCHDWHASLPFGYTHKDPERAYKLGKVKVSAHPRLGHTKDGSKQK